MDVFFKNYFSSIQQYDQRQIRWFYEGPYAREKTVGINSSSISTSGIDAYRQGVEITQDKHVIGNFKILAGTPGHIVNPLSFGVENIDIVAANHYKELDYFDPVEYLRAQESYEVIEDIFTFPIVAPDANQSENYNFNGIIEPLTIRPIASFFSIEFPYESHSVRGTMMGGNDDQLYGSSEMVLTVDYVLDDVSAEDARRYPNTDYFLEASEGMDPFGINMPREIGYFDTVLKIKKPFEDDRTYWDDIGVVDTVSDPEIMTILEATMSPAQENYINKRKKSAAAGFVYDNVLGTDSVAFGGMTY